MFVTFRTKDSIPMSVIERWEREKNDWLDRRGVRKGRMWDKVLNELDDPTRRAFQRQFNRLREGFLDTCQGRCVLRQPELAKIVADSLLYFDEDRYAMGDFVVMPNHVHLLAAFRTPDIMKTQFDSWLHYTAFEINQALGQKGHFWQQEPFDHLVRSPEQFDYLRDYIKNNPAKANLKQGESLYRRGP